MNNYSISKSLILDPCEQGGFIGLGSKQKFIESKEEWESLIEVIDIFYKGTSIQDAVVIFRGDEVRFYEIISFLLKNNFLIKETEYLETRYSRNNNHYISYGADPSIVQSSLGKSKVVILGCGGIGNHVSAILAGVGIGEIFLVDNDIVELSNLTR